MITSPTTTLAAERYADTSYWIRSQAGEPFRPFLQLGWRGIHASMGNKLPSNIEAEAQLGTWIAGHLGLYAFGAKGLIRNTSTTVGAGLKLRLYSAPAGGPEFFMSGLNLCATAEVARLDTGASHRTGFNPDPTVVRYGLSALIGVGSLGAYADFSGMVFEANGKLHFAPVAALGYLF